MSLEKNSDIAPKRVRYSASDEPSHGFLLSLWTKPRCNAFCEKSTFWRAEYIRLHCIWAAEWIYFTKHITTWFCPK